MQSHQKARCVHAYVAAQKTARLHMLSCAVTNVLITPELVVKHLGAYRIFTNSVLNGLFDGLLIPDFSKKNCVFANSHLAWI